MEWREGPPERALPHLQKAVALAPESEVAWYQLSVAHGKLGQPAEQRKALEEFQRLRERTREKEIIKRRLDRRCAEAPQVQQAIEKALAQINGNPGDPRSFDDGAFNDPALRSLCERVTITVASGHHDHATLAATVEVELKDGRVLKKTVDDFKGTPESPLDRAGVRERFMLLTRHCAGADMERLLARLQNLEHETSLDWLAVEAAAKAA